MTFRYEDIPSADATIEAEKGLGFPDRFSYWFVSRVSHLYGRVLMVWQVQDHTAFGDSRITPFDTGGLWHGHLKLDPPTIIKGEYVARYTYSFLDGDRAFKAWIMEQFDNSFEYVAGSCPPETLVCEHLLLDSAENDSYAWAWELRAPVRSPVIESLTLAAVFWTAADAQNFRAFLRSEVSGDAHAVAVSLLASVSHVSETQSLTTQRARRYVAEKLTAVFNA